MASLRFNYDGEKRPERGKPFNYEMMTRNGGFRNTSIFPMPPRPLMGKQPGEVETSPETRDACLIQNVQTGAEILPVEDIIPEPTSPTPLPTEEAILPKQEEGGESTKTVPELNLSDSDRFIASLENYESGVVKIRQQVDVTKVLFDELLFHMDSFLKIMDVLRENEERKQKEPEVSVAMQKTNKDTIDEVLELLQTPALQGILRQVLMGVLLKK